MAERRMFAKTIIDSDSFLDMPLSAQALYFHLSMRADDDGFINNPNSIMRGVCADNTDLICLIDNGFIEYGIENNLHTVHWEEHCGIGEVHKKRNSYKYRKWREKVLVRDNYTCQKCGSKTNLHVHHKKSFAGNPKLRFDIDNGVTLCEICHRSLHGLVKEI